MRRLLVLAIFLVALPANQVAAASDHQDGVWEHTGRHAEVNVRALAKAPSKAPAAKPRPVPPRRGWDRWRSGPEDASRQAAPETPFTGGPKVPSPLASNSFQALDDNITGGIDAVPPDTNGAVGPNHLMTTLNTEVKISDRAGVQQSKVTIDSFWAPLGGSPFAFDPRIHFDTFSQRWTFVAAANPDAPDSQIMVGFSHTNDPTGTWHLYSVPADLGGNLWADYPSVGFSQDLIVVQANMFCLSGPGTYCNGTSPFNRGFIYTFKKADLLVGTLTYAKFQDNDAFTSQPTVNHDGGNTVYLVEDWDGQAAGGGLLRISVISYDGSVVRYTPSTPFRAYAGNWSEQPLDAPQSGGPNNIDSGDGRMQDCELRNGSIWCTQTVSLPASAPTHSAVQWWQLKPDHTVVQRGTIHDASGTNWYAFPSIAVNVSNDVLIGYTRFSASTFASAHYSMRLAGDAAGTMRDDRALKAGLESYHKTLSGSENRWGDYSATMVDPLNDSDLWTIQEYADTSISGTDRWGTWWGHIASARFFTPTSVSGNPLATFTGVSDVTNSNFVIKNGTTTVPAAVTCTDRTAATVSCTTGPVWTATLSPTSLLTPGVLYTLSVNPVGAPTTINQNGVDVIGSPKSFRITTLEESSYAVEPAWRLRVVSQANGGSWVQDHLAGAKARFTFTGTNVTWYTVKGRDHGFARVLIDGVDKGVKDTFALSPVYGSGFGYSGLSNATHTIEIQVLGTARSGATDSQVAVDAFKVGSTLFATPALQTYWRSAGHKSALGGYYIISNVGNSSVSMTFKGVGVRVYPITGPNQGRFELSVDGVVKGVFDTYSNPSKFGTHIDALGLSDGLHTVKVRVLGTKRAASTGTNILIDRFTVVV